MLVQQLIPRLKHTNFAVIRERCSQFIEESKGEPLLKNLPTEYENIQKVKVRKRNVNGEFADALNQAFENEVGALSQRAVFANGLTSFRLSEDERVEPFYVFPIDGFKFLYSSEVSNSSDNYKNVVDVVVEQFGPEKGKNIIADVLKLSYKQTNLHEAIEKGSELILYNIPFYYGVRVSKYQYSTLLTLISSAE